MAAADRLPWPRAFEPSPLTRRVIQLLTLPPIIFVGLPLSALWNTLTYLYRRPPISLRQHLVIGVLRFFQATANYRCVYPADPSPTLIPKAALAREGVEYGVRVVPPIRPEVPVLPCLKLTPAMQLVEPAPTPVFAIAPKGKFDDVWAKAGKDEMCIFYIVGGGYQVGHPLNFPMSTEYSKHTGLRLFSPNYRKCIDDAGGYPAPLYDMLAGIQFVLEELEFEPRVSQLTGFQCMAADNRISSSWAKAAVDMASSWLRATSTSCSRPASRNGACPGASLRAA